MITCDFDHTLKFETGEVNQNTIDLLSGSQVIIISTRRKTDANLQEIVNFILQNNISVVGIHLVGDEHQKLAKAIEVGSTLHFDDSEEALQLFDNNDILTVNCFNKEAWETHLKNLEIDL